MTFSCLPTALTSVFFSFAHWLDKRTAVRLPLVLAGILFARGCRTVTSWLPPAASAKTSARAMSPSVPSVEPSRAWRSRPSTWSSPWSRTSVCGSASTTRRPNATVPGWRAPVSTTIPVLARRVRSTSTATSGSRWPLWASIPTGALSPCPCRLNSTSGPSMCPAFLPNGDRPSAPNWNWLCSKCSG